ncbi:uncharacterized protein BDFB_002436 [Asbolus verrucosus]|uniref:2'-phosphotransferase n=1 Tax=Asbolus verrucosus TaxID=1661398 RepID=A0A482VK14_ASBVE|nr:uncharacterized protein BDFB_002436 [Asbolus verrucosus]
MSKEKNEVLLSKTLSWLLRHAAHKEGLTVSSEGFVPVSEVINHRSLRGKCSDVDIQKIVDINDKKRFTLRSNRGILEIRANQGHSISSVQDLELEPLTDASSVENVIHGTYFKNLDNIRKTGLKRMNRNHIHFSHALPDRKDVISGIRKNAQVFIYIDLAKALSDGLKFYKSVNGIILSPGNRHGILEAKYFLKISRFDAPLSSDKVKDLNEYFGRFGTITKHDARIDQDSISIDYYFQNKKVHSEIIHNNHQIFDKQLEISWVRLSTPNVNKPPGPNQVSKSSQVTKFTNPEESSASIINSLKEGKTFVDQVSILQNKLQASNPAEVQKNRKIIYNDIQGALAPMFPHPQIHFFGSSITGLDFKGSDLDVYIGNVRQCTKPEVMTLKTIRMLIYKSKKFCDLLLISGAAVPIIKCIHTRTQICCDLNIRNKLSVSNSKLIKYYLTLDEKLRPLMITIKFWIECYGLKKANFFSGYAVYLMVIFYLQQKPYNLPTVIELQKNCPPDIEDGWNCAFSPSANTFSALNNETLLGLVSGFFRFYSNFDYVSQVICPYLGTPIKKICFIKPYDLPDCYKYYMTQNKGLHLNSGICIQDPFEHSRNVASSIPLQYVGKFAVLCKFAEQFTTHSEADLLHKLLTKCSSFSMNEFAFSIEKSHTSDGESPNQEWFESVQNLIIKTLKQILRCQVTKVASGTPDQAIFDCVSPHNMWDKRINIMKNLQAQLPVETNEIDREIAISTCIFNYFPEVQTTKFLCFLTFKKDPCRIEIIMKLKNIVSTENEENNEMIRKEDKIGDQSNLCRDSSPSKQVPDTVVDEILQPKQGTPNQVDGEHIDSSTTSEIPTNGDSEKHAEKPKPEEEGELPNEDGEEEEDVPADFFDDFSNQDFMDGLDIVDAWDDESGKPPEADTMQEFKSEKLEKKTHSPIRFSSKESYRKSVERRPKRSGERFGRSKSKSPVRRRKRSNSYSRRLRSRSRSRDKIRISDIRRDPEKTKRDINRDKIKCAKDKEQKLVTDKLKLVETGLVPPGTEMEVDIASIIKEKRLSTGDSVERQKVERERRYSRRSGSRETRKSVRYSRSPPIYRSRNRIESNYRPRRRTSSVDSNASERELWIRSSRKRSRSRSRDSPLRLKSRKYEDKPKKKTFLEEIRDKLNEVRPVPIVQYSHQNISAFTNATSTAHSIPAPVPAPNQFFTQSQNNPGMQQYDQRFFIGDAYPTGPSNVILGQPQNIDFNMLNNATGNVVSIPQVQMTSIPQIPIQTVPKLPVVQQNASVSPKVTVQKETAAKSTEQNDKRTTDDIDKLFADKKISLSDFLTITAKCEVQSASPEHLQKKIKVISRCQDAIKAMSDDRKFTGRLSVKPSLEQKNKPEVKYQSPLRRIPIVRFQFTSPAKVAEEIDSFAAALDKILQKIGVLKETIDLDEVPEVGMKTGASSFADEDTMALTLKASLLNYKTLTDVTTCEECKKRKLKVFSDVGSQCVDGKETNSVGVQVSEEDLSPTKGLLKNDSIAYLTPAQLLGKEKEKEKDKEETTRTPAAVNDEVEKKKPDVSETTTENKKEKPKINFKGRGGYRKTFRDRQYNIFDDDEFEYFDRSRSNFEFEDPRENFGHRFGTGMPAVHFPRHFLDSGQSNIMRMNQLREEDGNLFTDFNQPYRGRNPNRFGPRY